MTLIPFLAIAFGAAAAALIVRRYRRLSLAIGLLGLFAATIAALAIVPGDRLAVGPGRLETTEFGRLFLALGCSTGLIMVVVGLATVYQRNLPSALLGGFGALGLALSIGDSIIALVAILAGALVGSLVHADETRDRGQRPGREPGVPGDRRRRRDGPRRDGLDRPSVGGAGRGAHRVRAGLPRRRPGGGHPVRRDPVPSLGRTPVRFGTGDRAPAAARLGAGRIRGRRTRLDGSVDRPAAAPTRGRARGRARGRGPEHHARGRGRMAPGRPGARRRLLDRPGRRAS